VNNYVTGAAIRRLREEKGLTQEALAARLSVSGKAVSKWETGQGFPDVSLLEPIAAALGISVIELLSGEDIRNRNRAFNMAKCRFYVCPVCGNVITAAGEALISCCGVTLPPLEPEEPDDEHRISIEVVEDEYYVTLRHPMERDHFISFLAAVTDNGVSIVKLYPEGGCEARFKMSRVQRIIACCNRHGLFGVKV
jgi:transcriptional regulator with XRE-family HTH domain